MSDDILAQFEAIAAHAYALQSAPSILHQQVTLQVVSDKARVFGNAVSWERCRRHLTFRQHHTGILEAVATCTRHTCGISRLELIQARRIDIQFLEDLERGILSTSQALQLLTSSQCLFVVKGLGFSDADITSEKMERFLLQKGDWWV